MNFKRILCYIAFVVCSTFLFSDVEIYFAPNGGFAEKNNKRTITMVDGKEVTADLNSALIDMIQRAPKNGQIKIAMYAFSHKETLDALIAAARDRGIKVKLIVDACASWTTEIRDNLKKAIFAEKETAEKEKRSFDFQLKEIFPEVMKQRERTRVLDDGKVIFGTMHEKFGIIYKPGSKLPLHAFCGSANVSWGAGHLFAENRVFFRNEPYIGLQLAEEFSRLWNEYGTETTKNTESERHLPVDSQWSGVQIVSNSKPIDIEHYQRIDDTLTNILRKVSAEGGTIDVAMFSFTHYNLANTLLYLAQRNPKAKVRILLDQTQIESDENHRGVMGQFMENNAFSRKLKNFEIRYKWRSNAFGWDRESKSAMLMHQRNLLLHHKCVVVNGKIMGLGSYNWSESAEVRNFENIMVFDGSIPKAQNVIDRFMAEFNFMWDRVRPKEPGKQKLTNPQVIEGYRGRYLKGRIKKAYSSVICRIIMDKMHKNRNGCDLEKLIAETKMDEEKLLPKLKWLEDVTLIYEVEKDGKKTYHLSD
ncbi:phospholipase D-like domain-containing protein [Candidatus Uabimicrobium helgolandensis]